MWSCHCAKCAGKGCWCTTRAITAALTSCTERSRHALPPVNLAPEPGLASIQPATVQKDRAADLSILLLHISFRLLQDADRDEAAHSPVEPQDPLFLMQVANRGG